MRKLQIEDAEVMRIAIQQEIARSEESRYDHRLHGLLLVTVGQSCREVAELFGENGTTVQRWVSRFQQGGLDALREGARGTTAHAGCERLAPIAGRSAQDPARLRSGRHVVGWSGIGRTLASPLPGGSGRAAMPAAVSANGLSVT